MPISIQNLLSQETIYYLDEIDKTYGIEDDRTFVSVRSATQGDVSRRDKMLDNIVSTIEDGSVRVIRDLKTHEVNAFEVYLTLADCNIKDGEKLYFPFKNKKLDCQFSEFKKLWEALPPDVCSAIVSRVKEHNPVWGFWQ